MSYCTLSIIFLMPVFSPVHRDTKKPRGFTFCQYRREEDAADAVRGMSGRVSQGVELSGWVRVGLSRRMSRGGRSRVGGLSRGMERRADHDCRND